MHIVRVRLPDPPLVIPAVSLLVAIVIAAIFDLLDHCAARLLRSGLLFVQMLLWLNILWYRSFDRWSFAGLIVVPGTHAFDDTTFGAHVLHVA